MRETYKTILTAAKAYSPTSLEEVDDLLSSQEFGDMIYDYFADNLDHANLDPDHIYTHPMFQDLVDEVSYDLGIEFVQYK